MKLYKKLERWSYWLRYRATYEEMKYYLKQVLKGKEGYYMKPVYSSDRAIGKSCSLVELAVKYHIPIIVPTYHWKEELERNITLYLPKHLRKRKPIVLVANENLLGRKYDILLVEECLDAEQINIVKQVANSIVGYDRMY